MKKLMLLLAALAAAPAASAQQVTRLPGQDKPLTGKPVTQFSIGEEDGEDWELLSRVSQAAFDREENLYILDGGNNRVLIFNPQGRFIRKFGKKGGGPGELMAPVGLAITAAGEVAVTDLGRPAVSLFKKDGTFIKNITLGEDIGMPVFMGGTAAHPTSGVVLRTMSRPMRGGSPEAISAQTMRNRKSPLLWFASNGTSTKLFDIPQPDVTPKVNDSGSGAGQRQISVRIQLPAFAPVTAWGMLPNGAAVISNDLNYKLQVARNGKVERIIERPFTARKVTESDKAKEKQRRREQMTRGGNGVTFSTGNRGSTSQRTIGMGPQSKEEIEQLLKDLQFNEYMPVIAGTFVDPRGRIWVQRTGREVGQDGPIDLIDASGRYIGTIAGQRLPVAVTPSGRAAYIERDDMDVEKVVVRKLPSGW